MKIIALVPVRNEAWVLEHSLACWSGFCDVVIVNDQMSTDATREICRRFPKVVLLESKPANTVARLPQQARWRLLDAARQFAGTNILWCTDADELVPPSLARPFFARDASQFVPGRAIECRVYNLWDNLTRYRQDLSQYGPRWKTVAFVDDRVVDFSRADGPPLHEPRTPVDANPGALKAETLPILHLQWTMWDRNQMKQAWYRCIDFMDKRMTAAEVNAFYSVTLREPYVHTEPVPQPWLADVTMPNRTIDRQASWHEAEIRGWFDERGIEFFEALEIWHLPALRREFRRRTGRSPRPDRSYMATRIVRAQKLGRRVLHAVKRRILP